MTHWRDPWPAAISIEQQIAAIEREIRLRSTVFPKQIMRGVMTRQKASFEMAAMEAALETLRRVNQWQWAPPPDLGPPPP